MAKHLGSVVVHKNRGVCPGRVRRFVCAYPGIDSIRIVNIPSRGCNRRVVTYVVLGRNRAVARSRVHACVTSRVTERGIPHCCSFMSSFPVGTTNGVLGCGVHRGTMRGLNLGGW